MHIGVLLAGHPPDPILRNHGEFDEMFVRLLEGHGFRFSAYDVENMEFPENPGLADGWLISGSRHGAYEDHPFIPPLEAFIRDVRALGRPLVGICFGHQIIAQALGGKVVRHAGGWIMGRQTYDTPQGSIALNAWHQDQVVTPPPEARTVASNEGCAHAMLAYDRVFTIQAHPEFDNETLESYVDLRLGSGLYPDDRLLGARAAAGPITTGPVSDAIATFFKTGLIHV